MNIKRPEIEIPENMRSLPMTEKGYLKPWFVKADDFRVVDTSKARIAEAKKACWICGKPFLEKRFAIVTAPLGAMTLVLREPPCHIECAEYAMQVCPFLLYPNAKRRTADLSNDQLLENINKELVVKYDPENAGEHFLLILDDFWYHQETLSIRCEEVNVIERQYWKDGKRLSSYVEPIVSYEDMPISMKDSISEMDYESLFIRKDRKHDIREVTHNEFSNRLWKLTKDYLFAKEEIILSLSVNEVKNACSSLPIAFVQRGDDFFLAAVLGVTPKSNLLVDKEGRWLGDYLPMAYRCYPFRLGRNDDNELRICVDTASGLVRSILPENFDQKDMFPFFEEHSMHNSLIEIEQGLIQNSEGIKKASKLANLLHQTGTLKEWEIRVTAGAQSEPRLVRGFYCVDENKLNQISESDLMNLRDSGALSIAYSQLLSMQHLATLFQRR